MINLTRILRRIYGFISLFVVTCCLLACQKELETTDIVVGVDPGKLLVRFTGNYKDTSLLLENAYDAAENLISQVLTKKEGSTITITRKQFYRNADGRLLQTTESTKRGNVNFDTVSTIVNYTNSNSTSFNYSLAHISVMGISSVDSTIYAFSNGNVDSVLNFIVNGLTGKSYPVGKRLYFYIGKNLEREEYYVSISGRFQHYKTVKYNYENLFSPFVVGEEHLLMKSIGNGSYNNISSIEVVDRVVPERSRVVSWKYEYNNLGKPTHAAEITGNDTTFMYNYYYQ